MLPRVHRLRHSTEFGQAVKQGRRVGRPLLVGYLVRRPDVAEPPRIGFIVSKRVGGAVTRNRVRRRLRHIASDRRNRLVAGSLLVMRANPGSACASYEALAADFDRALDRLTTWRPGAEAKATRWRHDTHRSHGRSSGSSKGTEGT